MLWEPSYLLQLKKIAKWQIKNFVKNGSSLLINGKTLLLKLIIKIFWQIIKYIELYY